MERLLLENWADTFSRKEQRLVYQSGRYTEAVSVFEEPGLASASITTISTPGITLNKVSFLPQGKLLLVSSVQEEGVESAFTLQGRIESRFNSLKKPITIPQNSHNLQYNTNFQAEHLLHPGRFESINLVYDLDFFKTLVQQEASKATDTLANKLEQKQIYLATPAQLEIQPQMGEILQALQQNPFQGLTRYIFTEAKLLELLALQMEHIALASQKAGKEQMALPDREKLKAVRNYIQENYLLPLRLSDLCRQFGLNDFKLKKGYKQLFATTVFGHIHQLRMQRAKQLLSDKRMNVSEVAFYIGYNNIGSFSAEFKKRFGYSPSRL